MKKILLLSDTHSHIEPKLNSYMESCDEIWHAGDVGNLKVIEWMEGFGKVLRGVYGNIDGQEIRRIFPKDTIFEIEGVKIWMTHIGGHPKRYTSGIKARFDEIKPDIFICGHSHIVKLEQDKKYNHWVFNPGACGRTGFHKINTAIKFDIFDRNIKNVEVINLGERGTIK